jgi:hypothetical protein
MRRSILFALMAVGVMLIASVGPAAADSSHGLVGTYSVDDSLADPSATCTYPANWGLLKGFSVRGPTVWAPDTTPGEDEAQVGWRFMVKRIAQNTTVVYKSLVHVATATDEEPARFSGIAAFVNLPGGYARYIVVVKVFWYDAEGNRQGWAKHRLTHYNRVNEIGEEVADGRSCPPGFA